MANIKSAKKRVLVAARNALKNQAAKTNLKTVIKKFNAACEQGDKAVCEALYKETVKTIDQAVVKGILKKNTAARKKSKITLKYNAL